MEVSIETFETALSHEHGNTDLAVIDEAKIQQAEKEMLDQPQVECPLTHHFKPGVYIREVRMPAGTYAIGHYQKTEHLNVFVQGKVIMIYEDGTKEELSAPMTFVSKPGRKIGYVVEDVIWQNVYETDITDPVEAEEKFIEKSITFQEHQKNQQLFLSYDRSEDVADYFAVLDEFNISHEEALETSYCEDDQVPMPYGSYQFEVLESPIDGKGVFATSTMEPETVVGVARLADKRTPLGRYTNHSKYPNCVMVYEDDGNIYLKTIKQVSGCRGGQHGEELTIDYRQALNLKPKGN